MSETMFEAKIEQSSKKLLSPRTFDEGVNLLLKSIPYIRRYDEQIRRHDDDDDDDERDNVTTPVSNVESFVDVTHTTNVRSIVDEYMSEVEHDTNAMSRLVNTPEKIKTSLETLCDSCRGRLVHDTAESTLICTTCGSSRQFLEGSARNLNYNEQLEMSNKRTFTYKRISHFIETLSSAQGKQRTMVPDSVIASVQQEMRKHRLTEETITGDHVRQFLKRIGQPKYYESSRFIVNTIRGWNDYEIPRDIEEKLIRMFVKIQASFERLGVKGRTNFLRYTYVIYKLLEIMGETEYMNLFPLLKSSAKIAQHDVIWRSICEDVGWTFKPTR
jgi:hypothetical protein